MVVSCEMELYSDDGFDEMIAACEYGNFSVDLDKTLPALELDNSDQDDHMPVLENSSIFKTEGQSLSAHCLEEDDESLPILEFSNVNLSILQCFNNNAQNEDFNISLDSCNIVQAEEVFPELLLPSSHESFPYDRDVSQHACENVNTNTFKKRKWAINLLRAWMVEKTKCSTVKDVEIENYLLQDLNQLICRFILDAKDKAGNPFKPKTLFEIVLCIQQFINEKRAMRGLSNIHFLKDPQFFTIKQILDGEMKRRTREGLHTSTVSKDYITTKMECLLWEQNILGCNNPQQLIWTIFYLVGVNFGLRGGAEHADLSMRNFQKVVIDGRKAIKFTQLLSKTFQGGIKDIRKKAKEVLAFEVEECKYMCLVNVFDIYVSHRPDNVERFYLQPRNNVSGNVWFSHQPIGKNKLSKFTQDMCKKAGFCGNFSNHSLRTTCATRLFQSGVEEQLVCSVTGHSSTAVRGYKKPSNTQLLNMSEILQCKVDGKGDSSSISAINLSHTSSSEVLFSESSLNKLNVLSSSPISVGGPCSKKMSVMIDGNRNQIHVNFDF